MAKLNNRELAGARNLADWKTQHPDEKPTRKHGVYSFLASGEVPAEILSQLEDFESGLLSDLAGEASTAEKTLVANARRAYGVVLLGFDWIVKHGIVSDGGQPAGILRTLASYMNELRRDLCALGLKRRTKDSQTLESVLAEYEGSDGKEN